MQNKNEQSEFVELKLMDVVRQFGEEEVKEILSNFSCPRNLDVEKFIRKMRSRLAKTAIDHLSGVFATGDEVGRILFYRYKACGDSCCGY